MDDDVVSPNNSSAESDGEEERRKQKAVLERKKKKRRKEAAQSILEDVHRQVTIIVAQQSQTGPCEKCKLPNAPKSTMDYLKVILNILEQMQKERK